MALYLTLGGVVIASLLSLFFSTLTYSLRDFSRVRLEEFLEKRGKKEWFEPTITHVNDLIYVTALCRLLANTCVLIAFLLAFRFEGTSITLQYTLSMIASMIVCLFCSVAIPHALARHGAENVIGVFAPIAHAIRWAFLPLTKLMEAVDALVERAFSNGDTGAAEQKEQELEQEILDVIEEGAKEGVVDPTEREMLESVIAFRATQVGQIMSARPEMIGIDINASLTEVKQRLEESGHSRLPVFEGTLDKIIGILYARDLLKHLGLPPEVFNIRSAIRPPYYVPETKPLKDLLMDFRLQKVHIAIVLDEYGGTAGLVTIEDVLEELVGEISDEHEPAEPAMFKRLGENAAEVDARIYIADLNRHLALNLPEDEGFETLGGFISTTMGRIPQVGQVFEHNSARYTILEAEPNKVNRVKIELLPQPAST
jgi:putative hemolysin